MIRFVLYEAATGRIVQTAEVPDGIVRESLYMITSADVLALKHLGSDRVDAGTQYVENGQVLARPVMPVNWNKTLIWADGEDMTEVRPPPGAVATVAGQSWQIPDGLFRWATTMPGAYPVAIERFPFLPAYGSFTAQELPPPDLPPILG